MISDRTSDRSGDLSTKIFIVLLLFPFFCVAQKIEFEKGYYVNASGQRVACLIKDIDPKNNPDAFEYMLSEGETVKTVRTDTLQEFGIDGFSKFIVRKVDVDVSGDDSDSLSRERRPFWEHRSLPLKVLLEGPASLYSYRTTNMIRFFYSTGDGEIQQLVYKRYQFRTANGVENMQVNADFRQQLWKDLNCQSEPQSLFASLSCSTSDLIPLFKKYNACKGQVVAVTYTKRRNRIFYHFRITPGLENAHLFMAQSLPGIPQVTPGPVRYFSFSQVNFRIGFESEFLLRVTENKWGFVIEPTYQSFLADGHNNVPGEKVTINYSSIEVPIGVRRYFMASKPVKLFLDAFALVDAPLAGANVNYGFGTVDIANNLGVAAGGGINVGRLSGEIRFYRTRKIVPPQVDVSDWVSHYRKVTFILGYRIH